MSSKNFKKNYNNPGDLEIMKTWPYVPKLNQLRAICQHYNLKPTRKATRAELVRFLNEKNVRMTFSDYNGNDQRLRGAIIHWMEEPQATSNSIGSDCADGCECCSSDSYDADTEMDVDPIDRDATYTIGEDCFLSNIHVEQEVEVETMEVTYE